MSVTNRLAEFFHQMETKPGMRMLDRRAASGRDGVRSSDLLAEAVSAKRAVGQDASFRQIQTELQSEFGPASATDQVIIDSLAGDYVRLGELARKSTAPFEKPYLTPSEKDHWRMSRRSRRYLRIARQVVKRLASGEMPACTQDEAKSLARAIALDVHDLQADLAEPPADSADSDKAEFEIEDERRFRDILATVGPSAERLSDRAYVAGVLGGSHPSHPDDLRHIRAILDRHMPWWNLSIKTMRPQVAHVRALYTAAKEAARLSPQEMLRILRCQRQITQSIDEKRKQLRERRDDRLRAHLGDDSPPTSSDK